MRTKPRAVVVSQLDCHTGFGQLAMQVIDGLDTAGFDVAVRVSSLLELHEPVPSRIKRHLVHREQCDEWELRIGHPTSGVTPGKRTVYFTMWESSRPSDRVVRFLNQSELVVVPCEWNRSCMESAGVTRPIRVVNLAVNLGEFHPSQMKMDGPCVFGTAGNPAHGGPRKGLAEVLQAFQVAFPNDPDVRLSVKCFSDSAFPSCDDPRVELVRDYHKTDRLREWFQGLTTFVCGSKAEGFGLLPLQAMACGRPVIAAKYGGVAEYFNGECGIEVPFSEADATGYYAGCGQWCIPDVEAMAKAMQRIQSNRVSARELGWNAVQRAAKFTTDRMVAGLVAAMQEAGMAPHGNHSEPDLMPGLDRRVA